MTQEISVVAIVAILAMSVAPQIALLDERVWAAQMAAEAELHDSQNAAVMHHYSELAKNLPEDQRNAPGTYPAPWSGSIVTGI